MATYDDPYNPIPRRLREPTPGYSQTRLPGTERTVVETPRGGYTPDPAAGLSERDLTPENYAMPFSPTRSMRYGHGDERDLGAPPPPPPPGWRPPMPSELPPARPDPVAPRTPFADAPGESFADTARRGAQARALAEREGLTTADMDYIRSYGRAAWEARNAKYAPPTTRADYLARQGQNLAISVAERNAAQQELSRIDADQRRQDALAADAARMAALLDRARIAAGAPVSFGAGAGVVPDGNGGWTELRPPAPEAKPTPPPAPVGFGNGAGAIPEVDENGVTTWRESRPQAPLYSTTPRGEVYNNQTGDITHEVLTAGQDRNGNKRYVVKGRLVDAEGNVLFDGQPTQTEQTLARKYAERQAAIRANAGMLDPATLQAIDAEIAALEAKLEAEHAAPAPAATEQPAPAPAPAEAQPAPEPAQPAAPSSPTGHWRWTPGS